MAKRLPWKSYKLNKVDKILKEKKKKTEKGFILRYTAIKHNAYFSTI